MQYPLLILDDLAIERDTLELEYPETRNKMRIYDLALERRTPARMDETPIRGRKQTGNRAFSWNICKNNNRKPQTWMPVGLQGKQLVLGFAHKA